jgi:hypothetical protein
MRFLNRVVFANIDGASRIALEARIEKTSRVLQRGALKERQLDNLFVGFALTDAPVVGPDGSSRGRRFLPLPFLDDLGVLRESACAFVSAPNLANRQARECAGQSSARQALGVLAAAFFATFTDFLDVFTAIFTPAVTRANPSRPVA